MKTRHVSGALQLLSVALIVGLLTSQTVNAQEKSSEDSKVRIQILNQDGEPVEAKLESPQSEQQDEIKGKTSPKGKQPSIRVEAKDGKVVIIDADGKRQELDASGAQGIIITRSSSVTNRNGKQETKQFGKATIVGPDGVRREIQLDGDMDGFDFQMPEMDLLVPDGAGVYQFSSTADKYMIGVSCEPVGKAMASQLKLASGTGLLVVSIDEDSPAAKGGVKLHDILMFADQGELNTVEQLIEAVQRAGKEGNSFSLTLIRGGKERSVDVTPQERPAGEFRFKPGKRMQLFPNMKQDFDMEFRGLGPGIVIQRDGQKLKFDPDAMRDQMRKQMEEMKKQMDEMKRRMDDRFRDNSDR